MTHLALTAATGALAGMLAAAAALGVGQFAAGFIASQAAPVIAVGGAAVNLTPTPVKEFAIAHFGSNDKTVLIAGILVVLAVLAAIIGILARRRMAYGYAGFAAFAGVGIAAALTRPASGPLDAVPTISGAVAGAVALTVLIGAVAKPAKPRPAGRPGTPAEPDRPAQQSVSGPAAADKPRRAADRRQTRRRFLLLSGATAAAAAAAGYGGDLLLRGLSVSALRTAIRLPQPATTAGPAVPAGAQLPVPGITPFLTSASQFYRVDTDLVLPQVSPATWRLRVHGMVQRELELSFDDLLRRPLTEADITLVCVSNQVGGSLAGNARWLGASLASLLRQAGVRRGADQILSSASDGMTISTPLTAVVNDPDAMLAVGMNGEPLPVEHGFPVRMMIPGLYGYVSGTKWVTDLNVTTFAAQKAYWTQRGYAAEAPIKTMSRIDVPRPLQSVTAGRIAVAGVAWAPHRGIDAVEIRVDGGPWHETTLGTVPGIDTWRQWVWHWDATRGLHQLEVRATDGTGATQPSQHAAPFPDGASGWDNAAVTVT